jgi:hypothetical protein
MKTATAIKASGIAFAMSLGTLLLFWFAQVRGRFVPAGHELPLIVNSTVMYHPHPLSWFTEGYSKYFIVYPALGSSGTNFIRPVANALYFLDSLLFGRHWSDYLLSSYVIFAAMVAGFVWLGTKHLGFNSFQAAALGILAFLSPAFDLTTIYQPNMVLDILGATLVIWSFACFFSQRYFPALLLMAVANFTKETTHFAPFVLVLCLALFSQRPYSRKLRAYMVLFPLPVIAVYVLRRLDFKGNGGVYAIGSKVPLSLRAARIFRWPFHMFRFDYGTYPATRAIHLERLLWAGCSILFWAVLAITLVRTFNRFRNFFPQGKPTDQLRWLPRDTFAAACLLTLIGALVLPSLLNLEVRFAALVFPMIAMLGIYFIAVSTSRAWQGIWIFLLAALTVSSLQTRIYAYSMAPAFHQSWSQASHYMHAVQKASPGILLIVDDSSSPETVRFLPDYLHFQGEIVPISMSVSGSCWQSSRLTSEPDGLLIDFPTTPGCNVSRLAVYGVTPTIWETHQGPVDITYTATAKGVLQQARVKYPAGSTVSIMQLNGPEDADYKLTHPGE